MRRTLLQLNLIIAMMSQTIHNNAKTIQTKWKMEILIHVASYEERFPELRELAHTPTVVSTVTNHHLFIGAQGVGVYADLSLDRNGLLDWISGTLCDYILHCAPDSLYSLAVHVHLEGFCEFLALCT